VTTTPRLQRYSRIIIIIIVILSHAFCRRIYISHAQIPTHHQRMDHHMDIISHHTIPNLQRPKIREERDALRPVRDGVPAVPLTAMLQGSLGLGKTTAMCELVTLLDEGGSVDKIFYFSPTADLDSKAKLLIEGIHGYEIETFEDLTATTWKACVDETKAILQKWRDYKRLSKIWRRFEAAHYDTDRLPYDEALELYERDFHPPEPPYPHGLTPSFLFLFDDLIGNPILCRPNPRGDFAKWWLMSRHLKTSILVCSQVFQGGLSKQLRANCNVFVLLANKSLDAKKAIAAELSSYVTLEQLIKLWDLATAEPHAFLLIDVRNRERMFRKNWDTVLAMCPPATAAPVGAANGRKRSALPVTTPPQCPNTNATAPTPPT
jgi:hypothetical protein